MRAMHEACHWRHAAKHAEWTDRCPPRWTRVPQLRTVERVQNAWCQETRARASSGRRGALRLASGEFETDRISDPLLSDAQLRGLAATAGQELTYTCVHKTLEDANLKITGIVTDLLGPSGRAILRALIAGRPTRNSSSHDRSPGGAARPIAREALHRWPCRG
jgi:hypothetical protein